jgi:CRISPR system Cascade subunit CasA
MFNLLDSHVVKASLVNSEAKGLSFPELYEHLASDSIASFPALRPHQRHAWHALLCQLGALACLRSGLAAPPASAAEWLVALRTLTPDYPDDAPWHLISLPDRPAFLQAPVPGGRLDGFKAVATPDGLDMLVTAKNHDVKAARAATPQPNDWLFALVTLQTMEGFLGAGNYGVSRMNGGFANRPGIGLAPPGGIGAHVMRDMRRLIAIREATLDAYDHYDEDGLALVWLEPWDGIAEIPLKRLDPYYIEICRRVRLTEENGSMIGRTASSKAARIAFPKEANGLTGDAWTPVQTGKDGASKALTVDARGFAYKRLAEIILEQGFKPAPLQIMAADDPDGTWLLICRALARGQGKTEGLHERRIVVPPILAKKWSREIETIALISGQRIEQSGILRSALRYALMTLFQNGPERDAFERRDPGSSKRAEKFLDLFETEIDRDYFERLFREAEADDARAARISWLEDLFARAKAILAAAEAGSPQSAVRRHRAKVRADAALNAAFRFNPKLAHYFAKETGDAV